MLQLCVTAQFYLENKRKIHPRVWRACQSKRLEEKRQSPGPLAPLFIVFLLPLGLPCVNWASQECCLSYLRSSLQSLELSLFSFHGLFPSLSFSHRHSELIFPILPNINNRILLFAPCNIHHLLSIRDPKSPPQ